MSHKFRHQHLKKHGRHDGSTSRPGMIEGNPPSLSLVVKCDTGGSVEAVCNTLLTKNVPGTGIEILHKGVGDINKNDILTAADGSRLIVGFNVGVHPGLSELCNELDVEIRLYSVIYKLQKDIFAIAENILPGAAGEEILGAASVIALFKSSRKGIILGCQVEQGRLQAGDRFRVISAMGTIYSGIIESLQIERAAVIKATAGQQAGLKIKDFKAVKIGDKVESYRVIPPSRQSMWAPSGKVVQL